MDWWTIIVAVIAVLGVVMYRSYRIYDYFEEKGIPHSRPIPILGNIWKAVMLRATFADLVRQMYDQFPDAKYIGFFDFMTPVITIRDLELLKSITVKNFDHFTDHRSFVDDTVDPLFAKNLFGLRGERWKEVRGLLSPAFTSSKMKSMFLLMRDCANEYGDYLASIKPGENTIELKEAFTRYTNDVIATCAFGINVNSMKDKENKFYVYGREATNFGRLQSLKFFLIRSSPSLCRMLGIKMIRKKIVNFFTELVATTVNTRKEKGIVRPDMIQLMMETEGKLGPGKEFTIEDITAQAFIFFFGGFESTSTLMCFAAHEIGVNKEVQTRLQEEIDQVLENCNGTVTYDAINDMKYLDAVIHEALRMYPTIVAVDRVCVKQFELPPAVPGGKPHVVQEGEFLWIPIYGYHYDPRYYPEPDKFKPERFYDNVKQMTNSGMFLAFGMGPRMCIGNRFALLETKVLLFHIFAKCNLVPNSKTSIPMKLSKRGFAMTAENGFWFDIVPRAEKKANTEKVLLLESPVLSG
ncbi:cytochrome P450 9e2-like [Xylocopa sonorina]|uniref:cytochrome P450 9e2-like n=1 Tax=Xylocopa sonorina TaxID=1818115 RepID=UPI00403A8258